VSRVVNYQTGDTLPGAASAALTAASLKETERSGTGAVSAYRDTNGVWQHLAVPGFAKRALVKALNNPFPNDFSDDQTSN
jgi:hypothetical protein